VLRFGSVEHRIWSEEAPMVGASHAPELRFADFDARAYAA
jgi:hypothetical protein